jgi:phosphoesterase RecJ-like protein
MKTPRKLLKLIKENKRFLIVSHANPENDAIGSCIALALGLKKMGKYTYILNRDPVPDIARFLPYSDSVKRKVPPMNFDALIIVDCNSIERTGIKGLKAASAAIIDHHVSTPNVTRRMFHSKQLIKFIDENAAAAGVLVYKVLHSLRVPIDRNIATNLFTSIYSDTGGFRYSNTDAETLMLSSRLIEAGAKPWEITREIYENNPLNRLRLLNLALSTLEKKGAIAWVTVLQKMFQKTNTSVQDIENFVEYPRSVKGVEVAVLFREDGKHSYKMSLRSKGNVNVEEIAKGFNGGGHANAAGCKLAGPLPEIKKKVLKAIQSAIRGKKLKVNSYKLFFIVWTLLSTSTNQKASRHRLQLQRLRKS